MELKCPICISSYDEATSRPLVGSCGHSICKSCVRPGLACPFCRKVNAFQDEIINYGLLDLLTRNETPAPIEKDYVKKPVNLEGFVECNTCHQQVPDRSMRICLECCPLVTIRMAILENQKMPFAICASCCLEHHPGHTSPSCSQVKTYIAKCESQRKDLVRLVGLNSAMKPSITESSQKVTNKIRMLGRTRRFRLKHVRELIKICEEIRENMIRISVNLINAWTIYKTRGISWSKETDSAYEEMTKWMGRLEDAKNNVCSEAPVLFCNVCKTRMPREKDIRICLDCTTLDNLRSYHVTIQKLQKNTCCATCCLSGAIHAHHTTMAFSELREDLRCVDRLLKTLNMGQYTGKRLTDRIVQETPESVSDVNSEISLMKRLDHLDCSGSIHIIKTIRTAMHVVLINYQTINERLLKFANTHYPDVSIEPNYEAIEKQSRVIGREKAKATLRPTPNRDHKKKTKNQGFFSRF